MENNVAIKKIVYCFDKRFDKTIELVASISVPKAVGSIYGDYYCDVQIEILLPNKKRIIGIDAFQAVLLSIRFLETLFTHTRENYEIRNYDGTKYTLRDALLE
jgi:hypothetical protein